MFIPNLFGTITDAPLTGKVVPVRRNTGRLCPCGETPEGCARAAKHRKVVPVRRNTGRLCPCGETPEGCARAAKHRKVVPVRRNTVRRRRWLIPAQGSSTARTLGIEIRITNPERVKVLRLTLSAFLLRFIPP